jgi:hypothetical protein
VVELIHLGVEGHCGSLLECNVVLDAFTRVQEVRDHGGICHPVCDGRGQISSGGGLSVGDAGASSSLRAVGWRIRLAILAVLAAVLTTLSILGALLLRGSLLLLPLLLTNLLSLLRLSLLSLLSEGSSMDCAREQRGDENVLHDEAK